MLPVLKVSYALIKRLNKEVLKARGGRNVSACTVRMQEVGGRHREAE